VYWVRVLVNTPANVLGPEALQAQAQALAERFGARFEAVVGEALLTQNFPLIHAVGRAGGEAPRLLRLHWGESGPRVTLVGKGVCFDSGGLNLKTGSGMALMKKDMGGAAHVLGLAQLVMDARLPVRLEVLIPTVENGVAAGAMRPGDILRSRKGLTVEIDNTDAEGRLILADALALAGEDPPDLLLNLATLTGAARVALGPELAPFYTGDDALAAELTAAAAAVHDPLWRMPLWDGYDADLDSPAADLTNAPGGGQAGSIHAALFLRRFVSAKSWAHFDIYAWSPKERPGKPQGGEATGLRALWRVLHSRYGA
jgi:leucyl aminopeptidase